MQAIAETLHCACRVASPADYFTSSATSNAVSQSATPSTTQLLLYQAKKTYRARSSGK